MDSLCKLGTIATHILLQDANPKSYNPERTSIVLCNKNGSIEADVNYYHSLQSIASPSLFVYTLPNIVIGEISIRYGFKGENAFFVSEKFDADLLHFYVTDLLLHRGAYTCICGWADVIGEHYEACFFLVEKGTQNGLNFTTDNLNKEYGIPSI